MYCPKCGIENDDNFCKKCGQRLDKETTVNNSQTTSNNGFDWAGFLGTITNIALVIEITASIIGGMALLAIEDGDFSLLGIGILLLGPLVALIANASIMVFVNIAKDVAAIKKQIYFSNKEEK